MPGPPSLSDNHAIQLHLERILASRVFASSERLRIFLRFIVENSLREANLKESVVGVGVFGKSPGWDSRNDSIVRTTAKRLRELLADYYRTEGSDDLIVIHLEKGSYVPRFSMTAREEPAPPMLIDANDSAKPAAQGWLNRRLLTVMAGLGSAAAFGVGAWAGAYGVAITALCIGAVLVLFEYERSQDTAFARFTVSLFLLAVMAYIPSAATLTMLADSVVNISVLRTAITYPFITGLKFIPLFVLVFAAWSSIPLYDKSVHAEGRNFRAKWLLAGFAALGLTVLSLSTFSADGQIWRARVPGWKTLIIGYAIIYGINYALWVWSSSLFNPNSKRAHRSFFLRCVVSYALLVPAAYLVDQQYNEINRFYLDKRRPDTYRVASPDAIAHFGASTPNSLRSAMGPGLTALFNDPGFVSVLRNGVFYKQDFDEPFQITDHAVMFGYRTGVAGPHTRSQFVIVRFPKEVAEALRFQRAKE